MDKEYVLVTGASSGIGEATAVLLSKTYNVILNGRDNERLQNVKSECNIGEHLIWNFDLSQTENIETSLQEFIADKKINISYLAHCAGMMKFSPLKVMRYEMLEETFRTNVFSAAMLMKVLTGKKTNAKALKSAVLVSSNISGFGAKAMSVYGASKSGIDGLMHCLAMELAPTVRVNSVLPGGLRTRMTESMYQDVELIERSEKTYPLGKGKTEDIANTIEFLLSEKARWITGQQFTVDGGRTINVTA